MSGKAIRVAVASSDGQVVDQHFGWATRFHIFDVGKESSAPVEVRVREWISCDGECDPQDQRLRLPDGLADTVALLHDCSALLVARVGPGPAAYLEREGLQVFQVTLPVQEALRRLGQSYLLN